MTNYWDNRFMRHIENIDSIKYICEVGARYGDESITLSNIFKNAQILSFECNPDTVTTCKSKLSNYKNIKFYDFGLGQEDEVKPFYSYTIDNPGASSFLQRIDYENTQKESGYITIKTLSSVLKEDKIQYIDILCMDVQGYELNVLKGCQDLLSNVKFIIMEEPKEIINTEYLPENIYSKYINAPSSSDIKEFMKINNFIEIERIEENQIEDNVMYKLSKYM